MKLGSEKKLVTVGLNDSLGKALRLMLQHNISHIPVRHYKDVEGMISKSTIIEFLSHCLKNQPEMTLGDTFEKTPVSSVMAIPVIAHEGEDFSASIIKKLVNERVGSVLVTEQDIAIGIVTKSDVLYAFKDYLEKNNRVTFFSNHIKNWLYDRGIVDFAMRLGDVGI